jgi:hypothetical protein
MVQFAFDCNWRFLVDPHVLNLPEPLRHLRTGKNSETVNPQTSLFQLVLGTIYLKRGSIFWDLGTLQSAPSSEQLTTVV